MSLLSYKATFDSKNKYLEYFCENSAADWDFEEFQKSFKNKKLNRLRQLYAECLTYVKSDSKNVPSDVLVLVEMLSPPQDNAPPTTVNNYHNSGDVVNASTVNIDRRTIKKQKIVHAGESSKGKKKKEMRRKMRTGLEF